MDDLPFGKPVLLHSFHGTYLHNPHGLDKAQCTANATKVSGAMYASVILHRIDGNSVAIQTYRNGRFLAVDDSGDCRFVKETIKSLPDKCKFFVEMRVISKSPNHLFFVSRSKGTVLQAHTSGSVRCENTNRLEWESWAIVELDGVPCCCAMEDSATEQVDVDVPNTRLGWIKFLVEQKNSADEIRKLLEIIYPSDSSSASVPEKVVPKKLI